MRRIILFIAGIVFLLSLFFLRHHFSVYYFQNDIGRLALNIESQNVGDIYVCFDKNCDLMKFEKNIYSYELNQENPLFYNDSIENIEFILPSKKAKNNFESISFFYNLDEFFYLSNDDIKNAEIKEIDFQEKKKYGFEIKFNKANEKTFLQKLAVYFEGIFHNWYYFLAFYILILVYFIKFHQRFNFKIKFAIAWILLLALILRISHIDYIPFWNDELFTFCFISDMGRGLNLNRTFLDPGNPPLFFIISNIWFLFFNKTVFSIRLLPCLIGVFQVYSTYFVVDKILNRKIALIASFLASINILFILESNEIRSYILSMTLILWGFYWLYKLKNNFTNKNLIIYSLISILLINLHYYCILFVLANFILGMFIFKRNRIKYLISNIVSFLTFVPYFLMTFMKSSFNPSFNTWIEKPSLATIYHHIIFYFGNAFWFFVVILFSIFVYKKLSKNEKLFFIYNLGVISFIFLSALLISFLIKPILFERYFIIFLPFLIINSAIFLNLEFKTKFKSLIYCVILLVSINIPKYENFNLFSNINPMVKYSLRDYLEFEKEYNIYFVVPDKVEYMKYFKHIPEEKIIVSQFGVMEDVDLIDFYLSNIKEKKNIILYLPEICTNSKIKYSKDLNIKKLETTIVPIYKIVIK
ncbi:MAG: glycosyltransferase family 39 protein [Candidatus Gastranaerophilales bacterium]|nr:glycosyltransferase family 39 protein [Candidatus Gastranaerophilales bacterium]